MNRASLESCTREMQRIDATMQRIESNIQRMQQGWGEHLEAVRVEIVAIKQQASLTNPPPGERLDDQTLEIFSANLGTIAGKANEVDALKLQIQLLNRRLRKIEEKGVMPLATQMPPPRESPVQHHNSGPPPMSSPSLSRHGYPPQSVREENRAMGQNPHPRHVIEGNDRQLMEDHHALEAEAASTGWVSVNPGSKRGHPNEPEGRTDNAESPMGSPKRPKLAPLEPRRLYEPATSQPEARDEQARPEEPPANHHTESTESYPDSTTSANFRTYEASPEVRREEPPQRAVSGPAYTATTHSPRVGRPRGRGGRPRKYLPSDVHHLSMANWERRLGQLQTKR